MLNGRMINGYAIPTWLKKLTSGDISLEDKGTKAGLIKINGDNIPTLILLKIIYDARPEILPGY